MTYILPKVFSSAIQRFLEVNEELPCGLLGENVKLRDLEEFILSRNVPLDAVLGEAALVVSQRRAGIGSESYRSSIAFEVSSRPCSGLVYTENSSVRGCLDAEAVRRCVVSTNRVTQLIASLSPMYEFDLFQTLGLRNTSGLVGELFVKELCVDQKEHFIRNPNQDGYPDLCALTPEGIAYVQKHSMEDGSPRRDKELWSPFPFGGIEVKATCGNTPPASKTPKPLVGEPRLPIVVSAEWKAHHQETKVLLGVFWDFLDGIPTVLAGFFRNDLDTTLGNENRDWGTIVKPTEGRGRTTSVSIMKQGRTERQGVRKMGQGWIVLPKNDELRRPICRIFHIELGDGQKQLNLT